MQIIHQLALYFHVTIGAVALLLFWVPVVARKGSLNHRRFGRWFAAGMYLVSLTGLAMAGSDLIAPLAGHGVGEALSEAQSRRIATEIRTAAVFLLSLSILVFASTRQGWLVIRHKRNREVLRRPAHLLLCVSLSIIGVVVLLVGYVFDQALFLIFGVVEILAGLNLLRYSLKAELRPKEWWTEHLGGLIGAGIGAYTAFFVFGGSRLFSEILDDAFSNLMIVFWVGPGVVGGIAIALLTRHYRALQCFQVKQKASPNREVVQFHEP